MSVKGKSNLYQQRRAITVNVAVIKMWNPTKLPRWLHMLYAKHVSELMRLTRILPVVVCPEMSSPAQSFASVMNVPSNSCLPCRAAFCSFCFGSFGENSGSLRQQRKAKALHSKTMVRPAKKVKMLDRRKHHHFRSERQSSSSGDTVVISSQFDMMMRCSCLFEWRFGEWWLLLLSRLLLSPRSYSFLLHPRIFYFFFVLCWDVLRLHPLSP